MKHLLYALLGVSLAVQAQTVDTYPRQIIQAFVVGTGGVTLNTCVKLDGSNPEKVIENTTSSTGCYAVALATVTAGNAVAVVRYGQATVVADGAITQGDVLIASTTTGGYVHDTGSGASVSGGFGMALASASVSGGTLNADLNAAYGSTGGSSSCSGDINSGCTQVTGTHLGSALPRAQGGTNNTAGNIPQQFFVTAAPGSISGNLPGDFASDTTNHNDYWCNAPSGTSAPACTSVGAGGWTLLNGGSGISAASGLTDATITRTSNTVATGTLPSGGSNFGVSSAVSKIATGWTITISTGASTATTFYIYWNPASPSAISVDTSQGSTTGLACSAGCAFVNVGATGYPNDVRPIARLTAGTTTANQWDSWTTCLPNAASGCIDDRAFQSITVTKAGDGLTEAVSGGVKTHAVDTTVISQKFFGAGAPGTVSGSLYGDIYYNTSSSYAAYVCASVGGCGTGSPTWDPITGSSGASGVGATISVNNAGSTGTTVNTLTKVTGAPSTAVIAATTDSGGVIGVTTAGAGTSGSATIQTIGSVSLVFDGATTAGHYVQISPTTAGNGHDAGATYPTSGGQVIGRVLSTNGSGGTYTMDLFPAEIQPGSGGGGGGGFPTVTTLSSAFGSYWEQDRFSPVSNESNNQIHGQLGWQCVVLSPGTGICEPESGYPSRATIGGEAFQPGSTSGGATLLITDNHNSGVFLPLPNLGSGSPLSGWATMMTIESEDNAGSVANTGFEAGFTNTEAYRGNNTISVRYSDQSNTCSNGSNTTTTFILETIDNSGNNGCADTGVTVNSSTVYTFLLYSTSIGTIGLQVKSGSGSFSSAVTLTTHIPTTAMARFFAVKNFSTANLHWHVISWQMAASGLVE